MEIRRMWPFSHCPRDCGYTPETVDLIFQYELQGTLWQRLGNILTTWGDKNRAEPHLISSRVHVITRWRKAHQIIIPCNIPATIAESLSHQYEIGWLQALTGLLSHYWTEIQRLYLKSLRAKTTGERWMASLIRKLWDTTWDIWNTRNNIIHSADGPTKTSILRKINAIIEYHHDRGLIVFPERCRFLFNTSLYSILAHLFRQRLSQMAAIYSKQTCSIRQTRHSIIITDSLLLDIFV